MEAFKNRENYYEIYCFGGRASPVPSSIPKWLIATQASMPRNRQNRNRKRKVMWYNPPFNKSVQTNIGDQFLNLVQKHFPEENKFHQIFNKNNVKVSYSYNQNMANIIRKHNNKVLNTERIKHKATHVTAGRKINAHWKIIVYRQVLSIMHTSPQTKAPKRIT